MSKTGPIVLVEDDQDDHEFFLKALADLAITNQVIWFENAIDAFQYLSQTSEQPFIIFCDINLPMQNGLQFKKTLDEQPAMREKSIPFVFYSTNANKNVVTDAYREMVIQGFFQKATSYRDIKNDLNIILEYWRLCRHPNS